MFRSQKQGFVLPGGVSFPKRAWLLRPAVWPTQVADYCRAALAAINAAGGASKAASVFIEAAGIFIQVPRRLRKAAVIAIRAAFPATKTTWLAMPASWLLMKAANIAPYAGVGTVFAIWSLQHSTSLNLWLA